MGTETTLMVRQDCGNQNGGLSQIVVHLPNPANGCSIILHVLKNFMTQFVWNGTKPRLSQHQLQAPKDREGLGILHFETYYKACLLDQQIGCVMRRGKDRVKLERLGPPFHSILWASHLTQITFETFVGLSLRMWTRKIVDPGLAPSLQNPHFPPGIQNQYIRSWSVERLLLIRHCVEHQSVIPLTLAQQSCNILEIPTNQKFHRPVPI